jgi:hypothetical protein
MLITSQQQKPHLGTGTGSGLAAFVFEASAGGGGGASEASAGEGAFEEALSAGVAVSLVWCRTRPASSAQAGHVLGQQHAATLE